jgi:hypothetical protein
LPLAWINTEKENGILNSGEGSHFIVKNLRAKRKIHFQMYNAQMAPFPNVVATANWTIILLFQPII